MPPARPEERVPGRDDELEALMARYGPSLRRYFQKRVSAAEAEELVQDVFLAMHARGNAQPIEAIQGYLFTIAANLLRKRSQKKQALPVAGYDSGAAETLSPERILISRQAIARVVAAIKNLPPRTREAFVLHRFEDMTYLAIAHQLGISESAVAKLVARALAQISEHTDTDS